MRPTPLHAQIRPVTEPEIRLLERHLGTDWAAADKHRRRFAQQFEGNVVYLVAWYDEVPVGHVLLKWAGATEAALATLRECPDLEDLYVGAPFRSRGVGSQLLTAAEALATERGFAQLGLAVGIDNPRARALYEQRGYRDAGLGVYPNRWSSLDRTGQTQWHEETCFYLTKPLPATETGRPLPTDPASGG